MRADRVFTTIDTHTGGNPTRTLISGLPELMGESMSEKMLHMKREFDWIRKLLMNEPRGHDVMSGALLTDPCHPEADIGVIYIETGGYLPMCGHDTIGVCTALVESGLIPVQEPTTSIKLDTPAGLVEVDITVENGKAKEVSFCNIPAFLLKNISVDVADIGRVEADIAYGGNFYAIIDAKSIDLELAPENASKIIDQAIKIRNTINEETKIVHPQYPFINGLTHVEFFTDPTHEDAHVKNTVVVPPGGIDRSPCGTGTSAKLAVLYSKQEIGIDEEFVHESIVGSLFRGRVLETTEIEGVQAVVTRISGSAWLMGMHRFIYNEEDMLKEGFLLIPPMDHEMEDVK
ncbi:proline racemase family protein [Heyndrickxia sporothermodurans]|uniref:proline racemase family protein n=1 Tax=Heyndrickxia sporothermodurans TaxID=46224 RepID=UPI002DBAF80C|nr:proline racemase family protein [Heyndrickxia sporothermodurans]MEB6548594.1 proline racemase family protein [Heyndrickxia sporothermodurans]MED3651838.1 proline racemase family protein [Heyndrickxia sporothermodurans]MED3653593.1 proline racemase family protein [Heyndrickxia sporothermodurans]MED3699548.1 proline racemase family protein [Heyndrickxia sporothermodurans]MED3782425.1 proline racemase family protein [Heyndrickxia sporothermodurans]